MAAQDYFVAFGASPGAYTGLSPTFIVFKNPNGTNVTPPSIAEISTTGIYTFNYGVTTSIAFVIDGVTTSLGTARFVYGNLTQADRIADIGLTNYAIGQSMIALGTTAVALGTTAVALGTTSVALGTSITAQGVTNIALGTSNIALGVTNVAIGTSLTALGTSIYAQGVTLGALATLVGTTGSTFGGSTSDPIDLFGYMKRALENFEGNQTFTKSSGALSIYSRGSSQLLITKTIANSASLVAKS